MRDAILKERIRIHIDGTVRVFGKAVIMQALCVNVDPVA